MLCRSPRRAPRHGDKRPALHVDAQSAARRGEVGFAVLRWHFDFQGLLSSAGQQEARHRSIVLRIEIDSREDRALRVVQDLEPHGVCTLIAVKRRSVPSLALTGPMNDGDGPALTVMTVLCAMSLSDCATSGAYTETAALACSGRTANAQ
jgi:hypothetical protein